MKFIGDDDGGGGVGKVVLVGVKFDAESRELLTWALVKVAQPGDRVIALHVLDSVTGKRVQITFHYSQFFFLSLFGFQS